MYGYKSKTADDFIAGASAALGYISPPNKPTEYAVKAGNTTHNTPWSGAFVDVTARESGIYIPSVLNTTSGLSEFMTARRTHLSPLPGDIAFFAFPTAGSFGMGHVGIVAACEKWKEDGSFVSIEGNVSGLVKNRPVDGVHSMKRWKHDVICFGRPAFAKAKLKDRPATRKLIQTDSGFPDARPGTGAVNQTDLQFKNVVRAQTGKHYSTSIAVIQQALHVTVGLDKVKLGYWTPQTRSAFARFQRQIGTIGTAANGEISFEALNLLGFLSGTFTLRD